MSIVPRKNLFSIAGLAAFGLVFSLVACDDSSSASNDEVPVSSASPESSAIPESSSSGMSNANSKKLDSASCETLKVVAPPYECSDSQNNDGLDIDGYYYAIFKSPGRELCTYRCQQNEWSFVPVNDVPVKTNDFSDTRLEQVLASFKECNAENEGLVNVLGESNGNSGTSIFVYYRCEQGHWVNNPRWVACDTAGVPEGGVCRVHTDLHDWEYYKYAGNGKWEETNASAVLEKECTTEIAGTVDSVAGRHNVSGGEYHYFMCGRNTWTEINSDLLKCITEKTNIGDECCDDVVSVSARISYVSHSILYKKTEEGWVSQGEYDVAACRRSSNDPCPLPTEACTDGSQNKIDSTLKSAEKSRTCYSLCMNKEWKVIPAEKAAMYAYCGEPDEENHSQCCYPLPVANTEKNVFRSERFVYEDRIGWVGMRYYLTPDCTESEE